jgi:ParD-like antitoxin of type II bacterial toxin-antitoxin system
MWQSAAYYVAMAHSIRISDDLYSMAQRASHALSRPLAQQMEYWARLGAALDAAGISTGMAMNLLGRGVDADKFVAVALGQIPGDDGGLPMLKERQRKDDEEVAAGLRDPRSLLAVSKGAMTSASFTVNPASEYERVSDGW